MRTSWPLLINAMGPEWAVGSTIFEMWLEALFPKDHRACMVQLGFKAVLGRQARA